MCRRLCSLVMSSESFSLTKAGTFAAWREQRNSSFETQIHSFNDLSRLFTSKHTRKILCKQKCLQYVFDIFENKIIDKVLSKEWSSSQPMTTSSSNLFKRAKTVCGAANVLVSSRSDRPGIWPPKKIQNVWESSGPCTARSTFIRMLPNGWCWSEVANGSENFQVRFQDCYYVKVCLRRLGLSIRLTFYYSANS